MTAPQIARRQPVEEEKINRQGAKDERSFSDASKKRASPHASAKRR
jgi:hypothetical protein